MLKRDIAVGISRHGLGMEVESWKENAKEEFDLQPGDRLRVPKILAQMKWKKEITLPRALACRSQNKLIFTATGRRVRSLSLGE